MKKLVIIPIILIILFISYGCKGKTTIKLTSNNSEINYDYNEISVSNNQEFLDAVNNARPNTTIILENGTYKNLILLMTNSGIEGKPIHIKARNIGRVFITGKSQLNIKGNYVIINGLEFKDGEPLTDRGCLYIEGNHVRLTNIKIVNYNGSNKKWLSLAGKYTEVDHSYFEGKRTSGALLTVWRDDESPNYHYIHHNYFKDYQQGIDVGDNGFETIRIGTSDNSQSDSYTIVENNLFENLNAEIEIISIKSGRNVIRNNTIIKSLGLITSRHGKNNLIENNVIIQDGVEGAGGIRFYDRGHVIRNNYIQGVRTTSNSRGAILIHSGNNIVGEWNRKMNLQWTANNVLVENNTIYDSQQSFVYDEKYPYQPQNITFKNNVVYAKNYEVVREMAGRELKEGHYQDELYYGTSLGLKNTNLPSGINFTTTPFEMVKNEDDLWLHATKGAQKLKKLTPLDVGVFDLYLTDSTKLNPQFFTQYFKDWPFDHLPLEAPCSIPYLTIDIDEIENVKVSNEVDGKYYPTDDTYVDLEAPTDSYPDYGIIRVKTGSKFDKGRIAYVRFSFGDDRYKEANTIKFYLTVRISSSNPPYNEVPFTVYYLEDYEDWSEQSLNWLNSPNHEPEAVYYEATHFKGERVGEIFIHGEAGLIAEYSIDITDYVKNGNGTFTLMLMDEYGKNLNTDPYSTNRAKDLPYITIN